MNKILKNIKNVKKIDYNVLRIRAVFSMAFIRCYTFGLRGWIDEIINLNKYTNDNN